MMPTHSYTSSLLHVAPSPELLLPTVAVVNGWAVAALLAPVAVSTTVGLVKARMHKKQMPDAELRQTLRDFVEGR